MNQLDRQMLRDRVLDFLFDAMPCLLADDYVVEGIVYLVCREAQEAAREAVRWERDKLTGCPN